MANYRDSQEPEPCELASLLGLSETECGVYTALLTLGVKPASTIAKKAGLKRGQTYNILQRLGELGIVQEFTKNKVRQFTCSPPKSLLALMDRKEFVLRQQKDQLLMLIPQLEQIQLHTGEPAKVKFFKGVDGCLEVLNGMLEQDDNIYWIGDYENCFASVLIQSGKEEFLVDFIKRRCQKGIWCYSIFQKSPSTDTELLKRPPEQHLRKVKLVSQLRPSTEIFIFQSQVAIISTKNEVWAILISNPDVASSLTNLFWALWYYLPDYELTEREKKDSE